jgi:hypothetical protein
MYTFIFNLHSLRTTVSKKLYIYVNADTYMYTLLLLTGHNVVKKHVHFGMM